MTELIDKLDQKPAAARAELVAAMRKRKGNPTRHVYSTPAHRNFCFVGFAFEVLRRKIPDVLYWGEEGEDNITTLGPVPCAKPPEDHPDYIYNPKFARALGLVDEWLGLSKYHTSELIVASDHKKFSWSQLADLLEEKESNNDYSTE